MVCREEINLYYIYTIFKTNYRNVCEYFILYIIYHINESSLTLYYSVFV